MTRTGLRLGGFGAVDSELMVDYLLFFGSGCCLMKFWVGGLMIFLVGFLMLVWV